jgi:mannose-6-phosphate isomerase-like protein (cupin superfamily)
MEFSTLYKLKLTINPSACTSRYLHKCGHFMFRISSFQSQISNWGTYARKGKIIHERQSICSINPPVAHVKRSESLHFSSSRYPTQSNPSSSLHSQSHHYPSPPSPTTAANSPTHLSSPRRTRILKTRQLALLIFSPTPESSARHHHPQNEIYCILSGKGIVVIDGNETEVEGGSAVFISGGATHGIRNASGEEELRRFYVFPTDGFGEIEYRI